MIYFPSADIYLYQFFKSYGKCKYLIFIHPKIGNAKTHFIGIIDFNLIKFPTAALINHYTFAIIRHTKNTVAAFHTSWRHSVCSSAFVRYRSLKLTLGSIHFGIKQHIVFFTYKPCLIILYIPHRTGYK